MNYTLKRLFAAAATSAVSLSLYAPMLILPIRAEETATVTIENPSSGETYKFYRLLDLESIDGNGNISYAADPDWIDFFQNLDSTKGYAEYFTVDEEGSSIVHVRFNTPTDADDLTSDSNDLLEFLHDAKAYAERLSLSTDGDGYIDRMSESNPGFIDVSMPKGYYLMTSTMGTNVAAVNLIQDKQTIREKNQGPFIEKTVKEDNTGDYGDQNDAQVGDVITFRTVFTAKAGLLQYTVHDRMDEALEFQEIQSVTHYRGEEEIHVLTAESNSPDYSLATNNKMDNCDFELTISPEYLNNLQQDDAIEIIYTAKLTEAAVVNISIKNQTMLQYSNKGITEIEETVTKTWGLTIDKIDGETRAALAGASFVLKNADDEYIKVEEVVSTSENPDSEPVSYQVLGLAADESEAVMTTNGSGQIIVLGLDSDNYSLVETAAPAGYNKLDEAEPVTIQEQTDTDTALYTTKEVENFTGIEMPGTGGAGTTLIYAAGTAFIALSGGLFAIKRRKETRE